jgi:anthranilate synthase component 1
MESSPEVIVRLENNRLNSAGAAFERKDQEKIWRGKRIFWATKKKAEHIMLVDLAETTWARLGDRLGQGDRVDEVKVFPCHAYRFNVRGRLPGKMGSMFSGNFRRTVSGAPKIRAMEIIEELEPFRRGFYAGAVGYFSFLGNMDTCITIRSILVKDGKAYVQAGGGIVADSDPEKEYEETLHKARAIFKAIELAEEGLP